MSKHPYKLTSVKTFATDRGQPPVVQPNERGFHDLANALAVAETLWDEETERRRKDARLSPALTALKIEGPEGLVLEGATLRRAMAKPRD